MCVRPASRETLPGAPDRTLVPYPVRYGCVVASVNVTVFA